jgi:hypothetical protein
VEEEKKNEKITVEKIKGGGGNRRKSKTKWAG